MKTSTPEPVCSPRPESPTKPPAKETKQTEPAKILIQSYLRQHLEVYRDLYDVRDAVRKPFSPNILSRIPRLSTPSTSITKTKNAKRISKSSVVEPTMPT